MNTNSNENNSPASEFDFDSILLEFRDLKEERESEEPVFEPRLPIEDSSAPKDDVFSASIDTGRSNLDDDDFSAPFKELASALKGDEPESPDAEVHYDFNSEKILREFGADDQNEADTRGSDVPSGEPSLVLNDAVPAPSDDIAQYSFNPDEILREFESDDQGGLESEIDPAAIRAEFGIKDIVSEPAPEQVINTPPSPEPEISIAPKQSEPSIDDIVDQLLMEFRAEQESSAPPAEAVDEPLEPKREQIITPENESPVDIMSESTRELKDIGSASLSETDFEPDAELIDDAQAHYAEALEYESPTQEQRERPKKNAKSFREAVAVPVISALAFIAMKVKQSQLSVGSASYETEDPGEEMHPDEAAKFYGKHIAGLRLRARISFILSLLMIYIAYGLPLAGAFTDVGVQSAVCLILMLAVMICGLDIITSGIMSLVRMKPHASALIAVSCLLCAIDAFIIAVGGKKNGLPFCVIPSLTISFTLLGCVLNARSNRISLNAAASARRPFILTAEAALSGGDITLIKSEKSTEGFVRRVDEEGPDEVVFGLMAPYLIAAALILSLVSAIIGKNFAGFAHILSGIFSCAAPIAMLITFPLPFFISIKALIKKGSTVAGWSGLYDIGKSKHLIITDADLFPKDCVKISKTRILSGMEPEKVISFAASIISASGSALVPAFSELMRKGNGTLLTVEAFTVHESGGLIAMVDGEEVFCGNAGFMRLMGMHLPEKFILKDCVYLAASGSICGLFEIEYTPTDAVKSALYALMSSNRHPIFAIRDFNITPQMLSTKFDIATDGFDFPAYSERYEISAAVPSEGSKPAALISREGLEPLVSLADHGRLLYGRIRLSVMLSVLSTVIGIIFMFIQSLSGVLSVVTALTYLLGWLLLTIILSFTINTP